jgi:hypothetical protein
MVWSSSMLHGHRLGWILAKGKGFECGERQRETTYHVVNVVKMRSVESPVWHTFQGAGIFGRGFRGCRFRLRADATADRR